MGALGDSVATLIVAGVIAQTAYYTILVVSLAARISSRLAVMEFKVNELWHELERRGESV